MQLIILNKKHNDETKKHPFSEVRYSLTRLYTKLYQSQSQLGILSIWLLQLWRNEILITWYKYIDNSPRKVSRTRIYQCSINIQCEPPSMPAAWSAMLEQPSFNQAKRFPFRGTSTTIQNFNANRSVHTRTNKDAELLDFKLKKKKMKMISYQKIQPKFLPNASGPVDCVWSPCGPYRTNGARCIW